MLAPPGPGRFWWVWRVLTPSRLQLLVKNLQFEDGKMISAAQYFSSGSSAAVELTQEEKAFADQMRVGLTLRVAPPGSSGLRDLWPCPSRPCGRAS